MKNSHPNILPSLVYANAKGEILDLPDLGMCGGAGRNYVMPELDDLIPLPEGSDLFVLPDRFPVGLDYDSGEFVKITEEPGIPGQSVQAVAAFMAPAHTANHIAAFEKKNDSVSPLPLFAYSAVGWHDGRFWVSGFRSDPDPRQEPYRYNPQKIKSATNKKLKAHQNNRLVQHLGKCSLTYGCPAAVNYFMGKWEAPLPTSPQCNARCVGCISLQASGCCPSTQDRIRFVPKPEEIAEIAVAHLNKTKHVVSFGQGCEGEPLLQAKTIEKAIRLIREQTDKGTINLNSNSSMPEAVERLARTGLDSLRVSMNSAQSRFYTKYYRPTNYSFDEVKQSIKVMKDNGKFVSLNYFILPGFTDDPDEFAALCELVENYKPDLIQLRNLNMDPDWYLDELNFTPQREPLGIGKWLHELKTNFPALRFGYFNPSL